MITATTEQRREEIEGEWRDKEVYDANKELTVVHKMIYPPENLTLSVRIDISVNKHQTEI
jgi:hypothetical protein